MSGRMMTLLSENILRLELKQRSREEEGCLWRLVTEEKGGREEQSSTQVSHLHHLCMMLLRTWEGDSPTMLWEGRTVSLFGKA